MKLKNIFRIELGIFILVFLILICFSIISQGEELIPDSEYLRKIVLSKDILEKNPLQETNLFLSQDEKMVTWIRFSYNSSEKFSLKWEWINPQGNIYRLGELEMEAGNYTDYRTWYWIKIKGNFTSILAGKWKVRIYIKNILLGERNFFIAESL